MKSLRILIALIRLSFSGGDYTQVEKFRVVLRRYGYFKIGVDAVLANPSTRDLMAEKPMLDWKTVKLESFKNLPQETLGFQLREFLKRNGLETLSYEKDPQLTDEEYLIRRVVQTHDIWHLVLGYETDFLGEIGINSFMVAQICWPPAGFYIGAYILRTMFSMPHRIPDVIAVITRGYRRGQATKPMFAVHWESMLHRPLAEIRREMGVVEEDYAKAQSISEPIHALDF